MNTAASRAPFHVQSDGTLVYRTELAIAHERIAELEAALKRAEEMVGQTTLKERAL